MGLFKIPTRIEQDIHSVIKKAQQEYKPKIKVKGNTLLGSLEAISEKVNESLGSEKENFLCITNYNDYINYCKQAVKDGIVAIDTETDSLDSIKANLVGLCLYSKSQKPAYIPIGHISAITEQKVKPQLTIDEIKEGIKLLKNIKCVFHNGYYDVVIIYRNTGIMLNVYWDTLVAGHCLNENESHNLKDLYVKYILDGNTDAWHFGELFDGIPFCYIPYDIAKEMTMDVMEFQKMYLTPGTEECEEYDLSRVANLYYNDLLPMIPILVDMKLTGMEFDFEKAEELKEKYTALKEEALIEFNKSLEPFKTDIKNYTKKQLPYPLNYNSSEQIRVLFYDIAKIGVVYHKEPTGTGKNVINSILSLKKFEGTDIRNVAEKLSNVKKYDKVVSSFIDKLTEDALAHNGKIHSNLNLCGTDCIVGNSIIPTSNGYYTISDIIDNNIPDVTIICSMKKLLNMLSI